MFVTRVTTNICVVKLNVQIVECLHTAHQQTLKCHIVTSTKYVQFLLLIVISFYSKFINVLFDSQMNNVICKANELWVWEGYSYLTNKETLAATDLDISKISVIFP